MRGAGSTERWAIGSLLVWLATSAGEAAAQIPFRLNPYQALERIDSLERAAVMGRSYPERVDAVTRIAGISIGPGCAKGQTVLEAGIPDHGIVKRLAGIYRQSRDLRLRHDILELMPRQPGCDEVAAFLAEAADEAVPTIPLPEPEPSLVQVDYRGSLQSHAIEQLGTLGSSGEAALRRLHAEGRVAEPGARELLEALARQGFRNPDIDLPVDSVRCDSRASATGCRKSVTSISISATL
jgi:hypothetical protein